MYAILMGVPEIIVTIQRKTCMILKKNEKNILYIHTKVRTVVKDFELVGMCVAIKLCSDCLPKTVYNGVEIFRP